MKKTIAVIGASGDRKKYGNKCVRAYKAAGWTVFPVNPNVDTVEGIQAFPSIQDVPDDIERISVYVPPKLGKTMIAEWVDKQHQELWLNPGAADAELLREARELGLNPIEGCSIVDIGMSPSQFP
jgi:predicted CoA-binding protein